MKGFGWLLMGVMLLAFVNVSFAEDSNEEKKPAKGEEGGYVIEKRGGTTVKYKKKNVYDFEGADIEGLFKRPSGSYISNIKDVKGRSIIRIRQNFDPEVLDSGRMLR